MAYTKFEGRDGGRGVTICLPYGREALVRACMMERNTDLYGQTYGPYRDVQFSGVTRMWAKVLEWALFHPGENNERLIWAITQINR